MICEIDAIIDYTKEINRILQTLSLPKENHNIYFEDEEDVFLRLYDIKSFGCSKDKNIQNLWIMKEKSLKLIEINIDQFDE